MAEPDITYDEEPAVIYDEEPNVVYDKSPPVVIEHPFGTTEVDEENAPAFREMISRRTKRNEEIFSLLGNNFDPYGTLDQGFFTQFDVARSENLVDKQKKFRRDYPDGDLISVPTSDGFILLARPDKTSMFQELSMGAKVAEAIFSEPTAAGIAGTIGGTALGGPGGGALLGVLGTFAGTTIGEYGQTLIERNVRPYGHGEPDITESAMRGGIAAGADIAFRGVGRMIFGRALTPAAREVAMKAIAAEHELGLEPIAAGQLYGPFGRGIFRQVGVTAPRVEQKITAQEASLLESFRALGDDVPADMTAVLEDVVKAQQKELASMVHLPTLSRIGIGTSLQTGIGTYKKSARLMISKWYDDAIKLSDDVIFSLKPARELAEEIRTGVWGRGQVVTTTKPTGLLDETGAPITKTVSEEQVVKLPSAVDDSATLRAALDTILKLNPTVSKFATESGEWTAFEQIKALRTSLFDLKFSPDGGVSREAHRLWEALTEVMDNPISGNPEFVKAYQRASAGNWIHENTLQKLDAAKVLATSRPEDVARIYMNPNNATEIATIKDILPKKNFDQFRTGFMVDLMHAPTARQGLSRLESFRAINADGLALLVSPSEQRTLQQYLTRKAQFEASPVRDILTRQMTEAEKAVFLVKNSTAGEIQATMTTAARESNLAPVEFAQMVKAGVYKDILDQATHTNPQGITVIDAGKLVDAVDAWKKTGKLEGIFSPDDWRKIDMYQKYAAVVSESADIGGAMMAGSLRQKFISAFSDATLFGAGKRVAEQVLKPFFHNSMTAAILARPAAYSRLALNQNSRIPLQQAGVALTLLHQELEHTAVKEQSRRQDIDAAIAAGTARPIENTGGTPGGDSPFVSPNP